MGGQSPPEAAWAAEDAANRRAYAAAAPPGRITVFWGPARQRSVAALGLLLRALGRGQRSALVHFQASEWPRPEALLADAVPQLGYFAPAPAHRRDPARPATDQAWLQARSLLRDPSYRLLVLDPFGPPLLGERLPMQEVADALRGRPSHQHVVLVAAELHAELHALADEVVHLRTDKTPADPTPSLGPDL